MNTFAKMILRLRIAAELTQAQAGKLLGRDCRTISRWERGAVLPDHLARAGAILIIGRRARAKKRKRKIASNSP